MPFIHAAILLLSMAIASSCVKNTYDDWRIEGLKDNVLQVVVRIPLCEAGSARRCREDLNSKIHEAGRARAARLLMSYSNLKTVKSDKTSQVLEADVLSDGRIINILCGKKLCDALVEYSVPPSYSR